MGAILIAQLENENGKKAFAIYLIVVLIERPQSAAAFFLSRLVEKLSIASQYFAFIAVKIANNFRCLSNAPGLGWSSAANESFAKNL